MLRSKKFIIVVISIAIAVATAGYFNRTDPIEVELATITRGDVEATVVNTRAGTIKSCQRANLAPASGGQIVSIWVKEGERVKKGQPLLELWNESLTAQRDLAQRQLVTSIERRREACIIAENAQRESTRTQQLVNKGFISSQAAEDADANARAKQASCDAAISDIKRAEAQFQVAEVSLERTIITAPFAGIIAQITGEIGEYTTPSPPGVPTPAAIDLIDDTCIYVSAPMDEVDAPKIKVGQPARITLDAMSEQVFEGIVRRIAPYVTEIEKQARTVDVEVGFAQRPAETMLVGYSVDVEVILERRENVLRIPSQAIQQDKTVLRLGNNSQLVQQPLQIGLSNWSFTEIIDGLKENDQVLLSFDQEDVQDGTVVQPITDQP